MAKTKPNTNLDKSNKLDDASTEYDYGKFEAYIQFRAEDGSTPLHIAAYYGNAEAVTSLLKAGANSEVRTESCKTPLHGAAARGNAKTIMALKNAGADMDAKTEEGVTPLLEAAFWNEAEAITALLQAGANGKARTDDGKTPFDLASENNKLTGTEIYWMLNDAWY